MRQEAFIREILNKNHLTSPKYLRRPDNGAVRSYVISVKHQNKRFIIKIFDSTDTEAKSRFLTEIHAIRFIRSHIPVSQKGRLPEIKAFSLSEDHPYYMYTYVSGDVLGRFVSDFGIRWGFFTEQSFQNFLKFFFTIADIDVSELPYDVGYDTWGTRTAKKELQHYFDHIHRSIPFELYDQVISFFHEKQNIAFSKKVFSHRDLYPENIVLSEKKSNIFTILDWEHFSLVPIGFDAAFLYLLFWREEFWRARIFSSFRSYYVKKFPKNGGSIFDVSFRLSLVVLAVRFIYQLQAFGDKSGPEYEHARMSFLYILQNAINGESARPLNVKFFIRKDDLQEISDAYGLGDITDYEIFYASKGNTVARVTIKNSASRYIFRFYSQSRQSRRIHRELHIFQKLRQHEVKTYDVYRSLSGETIYRTRLYGRTRRVAVLSYISGKKLSKRWATEKAAIHAGKVLRSIHDIDVVHGDYSKENVLFQKSAISGVIDFEWGRNTRSKEAKLSDLAKAVALWLIDIRSKGIEDEKFVRMFLKGYYHGTPERRILEKLYPRILEKISEEKQIFLTTIDTEHPDNRKAGTRFENASELIQSLIQVDLPAADIS